MKIKLRRHIYFIQTNLLDRLKLNLLLKHSTIAIDLINAFMKPFVKLNVILFRLFIVELKKSFLKKSSFTLIYSKKIKNKDRFLDKYFH